jgi:hypothetical protein
VQPHIDAGNFGAAAGALRARLKVKNPVPVYVKLAGIIGATHAEELQIRQHLQRVFDMVPPGVLKKGRNGRPMPMFQVEVTSDPAKPPGAYRHQNGAPLIVLNRSKGGLSPEIIFHETGHYLHYNGPDSHWAAIATHFQRRTAGEPLQTRTSHGVQFDFKRDKLCSDYAARIYTGETSGKEWGLELPSTHLEHLASKEIAKHLKAMGQDYRETAAVALGIFYHGRRRRP